MHVPWILPSHEFLVFMKHCLISEPWKVGIAEKKGNSLLLEFGFRPQSNKRLSWHLWKSCLYGCDTWALCASSLVYNGLHVHACAWNVFNVTFWTATGLGYFFYCYHFSHKVTFQGLTWMYSMIPSLLVSMMPWLHGQECRTWCGMRWGCRAPGAQGIGERTAEEKWWLSTRRKFLFALTMASSSKDLASGPVGGWEQMQRWDLSHEG